MPRIRDIKDDPTDPRKSANPPEDYDLEGQGYDGRTLGPDRGPEGMTGDDDD